MKYSELEFKNEVAAKYGSEFKIVSKYISIYKPILVENKYGILDIPHAGYILKYKPGINMAINKTEYVMNMLKEAHPDIFNMIEYVGEYKSMKTLTIFKTHFGLVKMTFDSLLSGHKPSIRSAVNRKEYFKNQLKFIYGDMYDFKIEDTNRHGGKSILVCPIHGDVVIDNDYIFTGKGCPMCNNVTPSNMFYLVKLKYEDFECYKIGITYRDNGHPRRYNDYVKKGYDIEVIKEIDFDDNLKLKSFELKIKKIIKPYLITPPKWDATYSTECFTKDLLNIILDDIYMIWSDLHGDM